MVDGAQAALVERLPVTAAPRKRSNFMDGFFWLRTAGQLTLIRTVLEDAGQT